MQKSYCREEHPQLARAGRWIKSQFHVFARACALVRACTRLSCFGHMQACLVGPCLGPCKESEGFGVTCASGLKDRRLSVAV